MLNVNDLTIEFADNDLPRWRKERGKLLPAVDRASFELKAGETLGIIGESGSGKTTLARAILGLVRPTRGSVLFQGRNIAELRREEFQWFRRNVQFIFQNPYESLNPSFKVGSIVEEPLVVLSSMSRHEREDEVARAFEQVGLVPAKTFLDRYPHELSGGQRQRVSIARALIVRPTLLIADEPVSMLDVSIQVGILKLLENSVRENNLSFIYISHDVGLVKYLCRRAIVMHRGRVIEAGSAEQVLRRPKHPYTVALTEAAPNLHSPSKLVSFLPIARDDVEKPACHFYPRCPRAFEACKTVDLMLSIADDGHQTLCHLWTSEFKPTYGGTEREGSASAD